MTVNTGVLARLGWSEYSKVCKKVETQAGLVEIKFGEVCQKGSLEDRLKFYQRKYDKVYANSTKIGAWAMRVKPVGDELEVSKSYFRQYMSEISFLLDMIKGIERSLEAKQRRLSGDYK